MGRQQGGILRYFYLFMSFAVLAIVLYGFGRTVDHNLFHPDRPRPLILSIPAAVFSCWVLLFIVQSTLIRASKLVWHRRLGMVSASFGVLIPLLGLSTAIVMTNWRATFEEVDAGSFAIPLNDMLSYTVCFWLAIHWRRKPEIHRRLMLMAACVLTVAALARFPASIVPDLWFYPYVDALIALGALRDLVVERRVHRVYLIGLPCLGLAQGLAMYLAFQQPGPWLAFTHLFLK